MSSPNQAAERMRASDPSGWRRLLPAVLVIAAAITLQTVYGARIGDALLYLGYELGFVVVPGWFAYRALSSREGMTLRGLVIGWALGYVLEILAFMLTAAAGARDLFMLYPIVVIGAALVVVRRRAASGSVEDQAELAEQPTSNRFVWALAAVCIVAMLYVVLPYFPDTRLPGTSSIIYNQDVS